MLTDSPSRLSQVRGFTLIELLATIAVVAVVVAGALFYIPSYVSWARQTADQRTLAVLNDALTRYKTQGGGVTGLTANAHISRVLAQMQTPVFWTGTTHQFLQAGVTYKGASIGATGSGAQYRFSRYNSYGDGSGDATLGTGGMGSLASGLVAWWKFDEGSGTTATDSAGGHNGTLSGTTLPTWVAGHSGGALSFDGITSCVTTSTPTLSTADFTVTFWVKYSSSFASDQFVISGVGGGTNAHIWFRGSNNLNVSIGNWMDGNASYRNGPVVTKAGAWTNMAVTFSTANNTVTIYQDGAFVGNRTLTSPSFNFSSLLIGKRYDNTGYFNGLIDDARIYNRALSASEASQLYNQ